MAELKAFKVTVLPATLDADALYFVLNGDFCETYLTDNLGVAKLVGNSSMITQIAGTGQQEVLLAATIAARDALTFTSNATIYVQDATADTTVDTGGAFYFYDSVSTNFIKLAEFESMDVQLVWENISGRPTSTPAAIDQAVANSHVHTNKAILDAITDAGRGQIITQAEADNIAANTVARHDHANKPILDQLGDVSGVLQFAGDAVKRWNSIDW